MFRDQDLILQDNTAHDGDGRLEANAKVFDMIAANKVGIANPLYLIAEVRTAFTGATGELTINLRNADDGKANATTVGMVEFTAAEALVAGTRKVLGFVPDTAEKQELYATFATPTGASAGNVDVWISPYTEGYQEIKSGFEVK